VGETAALAVRQGDGPDGAADHVMVRVADVDAHCATARSHGAEIVAEPADMPYGERQYTARDLFGRTWVFSQSVADVAPESWGATTANSRRADLRGGAATSVD
jgi:hypothetical protein